MIKYLGVFPEGVDKNNLFYEQKTFLVYLLGQIPSLENWAVQVDYQNKYKEIMNIDFIELSKSDIDLARIKGNDIEQLKKDRLEKEKEKRIKELDKSFGISPNDSKNDEETTVGFSQNFEQPEKSENFAKRQQKLFNILNGKIDGL